MTIVPLPFRGHTPDPLGCLRVAKPSPLPASVHWSQLQHTPACAHLGLGSAAMWPGPSVLVSLYPVGPQASSHTLLSSLWSSASVQADLLAGEGGSQGEGTFPLSRLPPRGAGPLPIPPLLLFPFILPRYMGIFLAALVVWDLLQAFSRYSVRTVPHVDVFLMYLWEEVSSTSLYSTILISFSHIFKTQVWLMSCNFRRAKKDSLSFVFVIICRPTRDVHSA